MSKYILESIHHIHTLSPSKHIMCRFFTNDERTNTKDTSIFPDSIRRNMSVDLRAATLCVACMQLQKPNHLSCHVLRRPLSVIISASEMRQDRTGMHAPVNAAAFEAEHRPERHRGPLRILHPAFGAFVVATISINVIRVGRE